MFNSLLVFDLSKLKMRMLEGLAKHLEHVNEKLFWPVLVNRACGRMHPCCFGNETRIRPNPDVARIADNPADMLRTPRSEEHTSELQSLAYLVCRLLLEKKKKK